MKKLKTAKGHEILLDDDVYEWLSPYAWQIMARRTVLALRTMKRPMKTGYSGRIWMHRLIAGVPRSFKVRHINKNTLDNRRTNYRVINPNKQIVKWKFSENAGKSVFQGVFWDVSSGLWNAWIKPLMIGQFDNEVEAAMEYNRISWKFFHDPARQNNVEMLGM